MTIQDQYGRTFKTLRVSLTNTCNLGCIYCVSSSPLEDRTENTSSSVLSYQEIANTIKEIHSLTPLETIRLTGGEPTLYKDLIPLLYEIKSLGIDNIRMTSNGYSLKSKVKELSKAGLKTINISLDALTPEGFNKISGRKHLEKILEAIDECISHSINVKLNAVILKDINEDQIIPLLQFAKERNCTIRFLELMQMGPLHQTMEFDKYFFSEQDILEKISAYFQFSPLPRTESATANYWELSDGYQFGIIANESSPFCQDCNRLRLDSYGNIYGCLSNNQPISIKTVLKDPLALQEKLEEALSQKQVYKFTGSTLSMISIGG